MQHGVRQEPKRETASTRCRRPLALALIAGVLASVLTTSAALAQASPTANSSTTTSTIPTPTTALAAPSTTRPAAPVPVPTTSSSTSTTQLPPTTVAASTTSSTTTTLTTSTTSTTSTSTTQVPAVPTATSVLPPRQAEAPVGTAPGPEVRQPTAPAPPLAPVPDSRRLSRLLEDAQARRGRLTLEIAEAEQAVAGLEADHQVARAASEEAATDHGGLGAQRAQLLGLLATAHDQAQSAEAQVASAAAIGRTTPVARPPARGDTPADQRARARRAASDALGRTTELTGLLHEQLGQFEAAADRARAAGARAGALSEQLRAAQQAVAALGQKMAEVADDLAASAGLLDALAATTGPSALATADIPPPMLELYRRAAATCAGLSWTVLAAIGSVETSHGRADELPGVRTGANSSGAMGPMQFLEPTWAAYGADGDGDGRRDVYNPADAVFGAARYLCDSGAGQPAKLSSAIWAYNHADWYVQAVLEVAAGYGAVGMVGGPAATAALVERPSLVLSAEARSDLLDGSADARLVALLGAASARHTIAISVIRTGHAKYVAGTDRVSNHFYGRGVDIYAVDGAPVSASNQAAFELALSILASDPEIRPGEFGSPWTSLGAFAGAFSDEDHAGHLHLGWRSNPPEFPPMKDPQQR